MSTDEEVIGEIIEYDELEDEDEEFEDKDISTFVHLSPSLGSTNSALHSVMQDEDYYKLTERNLKLEKERRDLLEELTNLKESSLYQAAATSSCTLTDTETETELKTMRGEMNQVMLEKESFAEENEYLKKRLKLIEEQKELISYELTSLEEQSKQNTKSLHEKVSECEQQLTLVSRSERKIKELEKRLKEQEENERLTKTCKEQLMNYSKLEQENRALAKENETLRDRIDNNELLTYQLHCMRDKVAKLEAAQVNYEQLLTENKVLREQLETYIVEGETASLKSPSLMKLQLIQLQQKEIIQTTKLSELETELKIRDNCIRKSNDEMSGLKDEITKLKAEIENKSEMIMKLERKNKLIAKEREGCINVLNSYKLDTGADSVLKEQVIELEATNERLRARIEELTNEIESKESVKRRKIDYSSSSTVET